MGLVPGFPDLPVSWYKNIGNFFTGGGDNATTQFQPDISQHNGIAGALGSALAGAGRSTGAGTPGSGLDSLFARLMQSMGTATLPTQAQLEAQARSQVELQYGPQIAALNRSLANATANEGRSKVAIGKLYQGLAESYNKDKAETKGIFKEAKASQNQLLSDYTDTVKQNYQDSMQSLIDSYNKLGIQAAAGDSTTGALVKGESQNLQRQTEQNQVEQQQLTKQQLADMQYWETGKGTAQMEGTQRQADLDTALLQMQTDTGSQIEALKAQKEAAYSNALSQLQMKVSEQATAQQNQTWNQLLQLGNFQLSVDKYQNSLNNNSNSNQSFGKGLTGASNYLYQQFVNSQYGPEEGQKYSSVIQGIILQLPPGITAEQAAKYAADEANRRGLSPSVMSRAMLAYYGKA